MTLTENLSVEINHTRTLETSTPPKTAVGTHFHAQHGTKTILVFLPTDGEASWSLLQVWSPYYQATQCNQKTLIPVSSQ